jgi:hypothetical protein
MSFIENWTKRDEWEFFCVGKRSQHTCDHVLGDRSPIRAIVRTRGSLNLTRLLDSLKANSSLLIKVGN